MGFLPLPGPPFIVDLAISALIANRMLLLAADRRCGAAGARESTMVVAGSLLLGWSALRLVAGEASIDALRDVAPYMYCVVAFLVVPLNDDQERAAAKAITVVLAFQLVWATFSAAGGGRVSFMPDIPWAASLNENRAPLAPFTTRADFDAPVLGMFAAISLHRALSGRSPFLNLIVAFWALSVIGLGFGTSAGFLAILVQMGVVALLAPARKRLRLNRTRSELAVGDQNRKLALVLLLLVIPVGFLAGQRSTIVRDATLATGVADRTTFENTGKSISTANARTSSWERTIEVLGSEPKNVIFGVGFGPNYLVETGANRLLTTVGRANVRAPHNYWLNTWARTGLIGLAIIIAVLAAGLWLCRAGHSKPTQSGTRTCWQSSSWCHYRSRPVSGSSSNRLSASSLGSGRWAPERPGGPDRHGRSLLEQPVNRVSAQ